jgi:16S rRNA processing protein RimM|tara:strand:+ start:659 stop:1165 length:507 start_codon:yes stop_codon:yes gene_type:complete
VARAKGVRGEVGIQSLSWDPKRFQGLRRLRLERDGEADRELSIQHCRADARGPLIKFVGIDTPEAAREILVGGYLTVAGDEVAPLPDGTFYVFEVVGCEVWDEDAGICRGVVTEVLAMPSTDVYAVRPEGGGEVLIPAVENFVVNIDTDGRRIAVRGVEELFAEGRGT